MRTELYSVRSAKDELGFINGSIKKLCLELEKKASVRVLIKTEINSSPGKIKKEFISSISMDNPPEFFIYLNALDTTDSSSFRRLFAPLISLAEKEFSKEEERLFDKSQNLKLHINVLPILIEGEDYPAYCFRLQNESLLVLPRMKFVNLDYVSYVTQVVNKAKELLAQDREDNPKGYVLIDKTNSTVEKEEIAPIVLPKESNSEELNITFDGEMFENNEELDVVEISAQETQTDASDETSTEEVSPAETVTDESAETAKENGAPEKAEESETKASDNKEETKAEEPKKKKHSFKEFVMSFIPHKGDSKKSIIMKIIVLIAMVAFLVGAYLLLDFYVISPAINKADITDIQNIFYETEGDSTDDEATVTSELKGKNWDGLKKINDEIVGWVKIDKTKIDYPVLWHKGDNQDSQYYLYRNYKEKYSDFGSIFIDYRCKEGPDSRHVILHGHNMGSDKSMFAQLTKYPGNVKFYKSSPIVHFDTPELEGDWIIYSVMKIDVANQNKEIFNYLMGEFESDAQFMNFIYNQKVRSYLDVDVPINENDRILTLSTCSYETDNMRTIVVARQLREGENYEKYVKKAENQQPASKAYSTFQTELANKNITWYDGDGKLEGSEDIPYMEQADMFVVKFVDAKGKVIDTQQVLKGKDAKPPKENPRKAASNGYYYVFKGWSPSYKNVQKNLTVKPVFTQKALNIVVETTRWETDPPEENVTPVTPAPQPQPQPNPDPVEPETTKPVTTTAAPDTTAPAA